MIPRKINSSQAQTGAADVLSGPLERIAGRYTVHPAHTIDRSELMEFFKTAYADQFNAAGYQDEKKIAEKWEWANINNPNKYSFQSLAWICRESASNKIAGHFGIMPVSLKYKDDYLPAVWGRDLIVLPEFRKLGIGPLLVASVLKEVKDKAAIFLIAGVRDHVYTMYRKFGFADMGYIPLYVRVNRVGPLVRSKIGAGPFTQLISALGAFAARLYYAPSRVREHILRRKECVCIERISHFGDSFNNLWKAASASFDLIVRRDSAYLEWRFVEQPYCDYSLFKAYRKDSEALAGYIVLREGRSRGLCTGVITGIFASSNDPDIMATLINFAVSYFEKRDDIALIRCDILNKDAGIALRKCGFSSIYSSERFMFTNIQQGLDAAFIMERDNWFIDYSDSDLDLSGLVSA